MPTGTRKSTYATPEFMKAAKFAEAEKKAIDTANPNDSTLPKCPYVGVQFAAIPEFQAIGVAVGQQMSAALSGKATVDQALKTVADRGRARDEEGRVLQVKLASAERRPRATCACAHRPRRRPRRPTSETPRLNRLPAARC